MRLLDTDGYNTSLSLDHLEVFVNANQAANQCRSAGLFRSICGLYPPADLDFLLTFRCRFGRKIVTFNPMIDGIEQLIGLGTPVWYPKNYILQREGHFSSKIWVMEKGIARYIYYKESKEITGWIDLEGDIVGSVFSTIGLGPARETIQLVEDSELHEISLEHIQKETVFFTQFKSQVLLHYFIELENRVKFFQSLSGKERYAHLLEHRPDLLLRVPLHMLSSYLGLTPESLSRIRGSLS